MKTITVIVPPISDYPKLGDSHEVFRQKADIAWRDLTGMVPEANKWSAQVNDLAVQLYGWLQTTQIASGAADAARVEAVAAKEEAKEARDDAIEAKEAIEGYVIPTDATYAPHVIDAKMRRNRVLTLTKSI